MESKNDDSELCDGEDVVGDGNVSPVEEVTVEMFPSV